MSEKRAMVALLVVKEKSNGTGFYQAVKLFDDGSTQDVAREDLEFALDWIVSKEARKKMHPRYRWRPWGIWYNDAPGIAFAETRESVLKAWMAAHSEDRLVPAPCTYQTREWWEKRRRTDWGLWMSSTVAYVGDAGVITPTLTKAEIVRKRDRYYWYAGDLAMVPKAVLDEMEDDRRRREAFSARTQRRAPAVA